MARKAKHDISEMVSAHTIRSLVSYDPQTGIMRWREREVNRPADKTFNSKFAGRIVGNLKADGYLQTCVTIDGVRYRTYVHILAHAYIVGEWSNFVDHEDHDRSNNRWINLRACTLSQNSANQTVKKANSSGFKGVSFEARRGKWRASINPTKRGGTKNLGRYDKPEDAARAYDAAAIQLFGEFARTNAMMGLV